MASASSGGDFAAISVPARTAASAAAVPFFRPELSDSEIEEVVSVLRSGWLTSGPVTARFEKEFAATLGAPYAVAVNSCTAALHLAVEALGLSAGQVVLVPAMTFAATAEVVRYCGGIPLLIDCDPVTCNLDLRHAERRIADLRAGKIPWISPAAAVVGLMPVHVGGLMIDIGLLHEFARRHHLWLVEDAAHAFPAAWRESESHEWRWCGNRTAQVTCFSFYANKTITTGEGGMATCSDERIAHRIRTMSLHGLSHDAWGRYSGSGTWDYRIIAPGFKYNFPDPLAALGIHQLARAEVLRQKREQLAKQYRARLGDLAELEIPPLPENRMHSWHLFPVRLRLERLRITRDQFLGELRQSGIGYSVHWRPLNLHPYYQETFGYQAEDCPVAAGVFERLVSLPLFPGLRPDEFERVVETVRLICRTAAK